MQSKDLINLMTASPLATTCYLADVISVRLRVSVQVSMVPKGFSLRCLITFLMWSKMPLTYKSSYTFTRVHVAQHVESLIKPNVKTIKKQIQKCSLARNYNLNEKSKISISSRQTKTRLVIALDIIKFKCIKMWSFPQGRRQV